MNELMDKFMKELKEISPTFGWNQFKSGSYYDKTKVQNVTSFQKCLWGRGVESKMIFIFSYEMFEDTKGTIRNRKWTNRTEYTMDKQDRIYNGQLKRTKMDKQLFI